MKEKSPEEIEWAAVAKTFTSVTRLKHSLRADEEIYTNMPAVRAKFEEALARGELKELKADISDVLNLDIGGE